MYKLLKMFNKKVRLLRNNKGFATLLADNATLDQGGGPSVLGLGLKNARVKVNTESYALTTAATSGSTIDIGAALPKGAHVLAIGVSVTVAQTALTLSIGDDASATRYASASTSLQTAGFYWFSGKNYKTGQSSGDTQIVFTTGGATATAAQLEVIILFSMD